MRYALIGLLALAGFALATPASAQYWGPRHHHWRGYYGPGFGFYGPRYYGGPRFYGRGRCIRERIVRFRPNGVRVVTYVTRCY